MRNGASRSPKCSRYIVIGGWRGCGLSLLAYSAARFARIGGNQFSTGAPGRFQPSGERAARHAEQFRRLRHVALRDLERGVEIGLLDALERRIEAERSPGQELGARPRHRIEALAFGCGREFLLELLGAHGVTRVLGGEPDHDVLQLAHVARKRILDPTGAAALADLE